MNPNPSRLVLAGWFAAGVVTAAVVIVGAAALVAAAWADESDLRSDG